MESNDSLKYNKPIDKKTFDSYINMSLDDKIELSKDIIREFYEEVNENEDGKMFISSSFGKDSIVLIDLVRSIYPNIPIIHSDTGLEYKGVYETKKLYDNVLTVKPIKTMEEIIEEYGYILPIGKRKTTTLRRSRDSIVNKNWDNDSFKRLSGRDKYKKGSFYNEESALKYIICPFPISEKCDFFLKKRPLDKFLKDNDYKYLFHGITYDESFLRKSNLMRDGFISKNKCRAIGHWNTSEILEYITLKGLKYGDYYGEIIQNDDGTYATTLFKRNGCYCCPCGSHLDKEPNRFQLLYDYDYDAWKHTIYDLNFKQVLDYFEIPYYPKDVVEKNKNEKIKNLDDFIG